MFNNVGKKIMTFAKVLFWFLVIGCALAGLIMAIELDEGFLLLVPAGLLLAPGAWMIYGFGQLVEDIHTNRGRAPSPAPVEKQVVPEELPDL